MWRWSQNLCWCTGLLVIHMSRVAKDGLRPPVVHATRRDAIIQVKWHYLGNSPGERYLVTTIINGLTRTSLWTALKRSFGLPRHVAFWHCWCDWVRVVPLYPWCGAEPTSRSLRFEIAKDASPTKFPAPLGLHPLDKQQCLEYNQTNSGRDILSVVTTSNAHDCG